MLSSNFQTRCLSGGLAGRPLSRLTRPLERNEGAGEEGWGGRRRSTKSLWKRVDAVMYLYQGSERNPPAQNDLHSSRMLFL
ncbi:hypothetical protein CDAR_209621 [Caerostris darwini]|uniref:Uncharacterized protein n=1 Tax=Caerostris darwini TaxID=1538125 RepID=A0AAV4T3H5_9ARAC|nr:hypothetical protein CDAR_209621 [Caerostris darwini]